MAINLAIMVYNARDINKAYQIAGNHKEPVIGKNYIDDELDYLRIILSQSLTYHFQYLLKEYEIASDCIILSLDEFAKLKLNLDLGLIPFDYDIIRERGMK